MSAVLLENRHAADLKRRRTLAGRLWALAGAWGVTL